MNDTVDTWLENRVTALTGKSTAELREIGEEINSRAFFVAKLSTASVANPLREISDDYVKGKITLSEAQQRIRDMASGSQDEIARQLATRSRATQVLQNQRQMARGVAEWQSWQENKEDFPYIIYHANRDGFVRESHKALDGMVFSVDDPFLQTHMPGEWDYNCRCWGEQVTKKRGEREAAKSKTGDIEPVGKADYTAESGYMFNPANAFMPDASQLKDKTQVVQSMAESVRHGAIRKMGMIVSSPAQSYTRADLPGLSRMTAEMRKLQPKAEDSATKAKWDYKKQPNFVQQAEKYNQNNPDEAKKLPDAIRQEWKCGEITVGSISRETCRNAGIGDLEIPVKLDIGGKDDGLAHDWQHHKEVFLDPDEGERIIRATLGNPKSQVSVTFENQSNKFRQVVTFFDPRTKSYCVLRYDDQAKAFRLMSWHRSPASYGEGEWEIRGEPTPKLDANGDPILDEKGKPVQITDKTRQRDYWRKQHAKK